MKLGGNVYKERDDIIAALWIKGHSQSEIAYLLKPKGYDMQPGAIAGVIARRGLGRSKEQLSAVLSHAAFNSHAKRKNKVKQALPQRDADPDEPEPIGRPGTIPSDGHCKYIRGEVGQNFQACGHATESRKHPYCPWHQKMLDRDRPKTKAPRPPYEPRYKSQYDGTLNFSRY